MSQPVARNSDLVVATDVHQEIKQTGSGPVIVPVEHAHRGPFVRGLADSFRINGERVALEGAVALTLAAPLRTPLLPLRTPSRAALARCS